MTDTDKGNAEDRMLRDPFEVFSSSEERAEAIRRFEEYLAKLKEWDRIVKRRLPGPSEN